jgi:PhnB protein
MKQVSTYLNFDGNTEEAFNFYRSVFGGDFMGIFRFREAGGTQMGIPDADLDKIMHIALAIGPGHLLMGTDTLKSLGQTLRQGNNVYLALEADSADEAKRLYDALSAEGKVEMELQKTDWAELYSSLVDRHGVQWMVSYTGSVQFTPGP